uniref:DUF868 domain-containing protein n=1 Tax=Kalanchoe fedtschenkoi TaxID=63787 RepID=A0A7N0V2Q3_KALFE
MKSVATCYSEHAVKISDSYCSGPKPYLSQNLIPSVLNSVTCVYRSRLRNEDDQVLTSLTWTNSLMGRGFDIQIVHKSCAGSDHLRKSKGSNTIAFHQTSSSIFEVKWDLSGAEYENGPEPGRNFYVMVSMNSKPILLLGDYEEHGMNPGYATFLPVSRTESFSGSAEYSTKAQFCHTGIPHDIVIKCGREEDGLKDPILSVSVDRKRVVIMKKLQWNFRGNQCIFVDGIVVDMMWDVHDWFFNTVSGRSSFLFRTRSGFDSRLLWLEKDKSLKEKEEDNKPEFSLLVTACRRHPH